ncbi:reverse transcriptase domain-containing protein [Tanacetum coccineum]
MGRSRSSRGTSTYSWLLTMSKWVEAKALPTNDARVVCKFLKTLFSRFGAHPELSEVIEGNHFCNDNLQRSRLKSESLTSLTAYHPPKHVAVEVSNNDALWAFRTAYKTPIGCTPYKLVYGKACHLPIELEHKAYWALKHTNFDIQTAGDHRKVQLNELNELRDQAYENSLIYKEKTKKIHDAKIKNRVFNVGDRVLLFNSRLKIFSGIEFPISQIVMYSLASRSINMSFNPQLQVEIQPIVSTDGSKVSTDEQVEGTEEHNEGTEEKNEGTEEIFEGTEEQREGTEEKVESTAGQIKGTEDQTKEEIASKASQTSTQTPTSMIFGDDETIATLLLNMSQAKAASKEKEKGVELKDVEEIDRPRPTSQRSLLTLKPLPKIDPKDKGKKKIEEEDESESEDDDIPQAVKKFKQLESDEEMARKIQEEWEAEEERNKIAEEKATNEALIKNFDDIKARIEADRILAEKLQEQEREQFTIEERAKFLHDTIAAQRKFLARQRSEAIRNRPPTKNQLRNQMMTYLKHVGNFKHSELKNESLIKRMNKKDSSKGEEIKQESKEEVKQEDKEEENTRKRKLGTRKKMKSRKRRFKQDTSQDEPSDTKKENDELRLCLTIAPDEDKECLTEKTDEIDANINIVMTYSKIRFLKVLIKFLWGDLILCSIQKNKNEFWNSQHEVRRKYSFEKGNTGCEMLKLKLESEEESTMALELIRFIKKGSQLTLLLGEELASKSNSSALASPNTNDEELSIPEQTATGKGTSNPLMAELLKKTKVAAKEWGDRSVQD